MEIQLSNKETLLLYDLYFFRYKLDTPWYEVSDLIREYFVKRGCLVKYNNKEKDIIIDNLQEDNITINNLSLKKLFEI